MDPFSILTSCLIPLPYNNVDTDQIIPARYLKVTKKTGLAEGLFSAWRYQANGDPDPDFPLNQSRYQSCQILLAGDNFGCGSSREHAPWALVGWGIRAIISTSFADIFYNNALKNGLLPVQVDPETYRLLMTMTRDSMPVQVTIDLAAQELHLPDGAATRFPLDPFYKICLLEGVDPLGYLLKHEPQIVEYERWNQASGR